MFENVDRRTTDGRRRRTPDPWVSYKLAGEPSAQVSKKKKKTEKEKKDNALIDINQYRD